ncbi:hypothetical protein [Afipia carboxidovorans]|uniref:hypothetical protein n=1 Tax=Afipia carboxidovorans TaxID=40137 RepID=UPI0030929BB7|nr:hypothetical protein CRBSH125_06020 [Afipia carboxidovorans]
MFTPNLLIGGSLLLPELPRSDIGVGGNIALRGVVTAANFSFKGVAKAIRVGLGGHTVNSGMVSSAYVGHAGTVPNFDGNQVQLKFAGSASAALSAGILVSSDITPFIFDPTKDLIISLGYSTYYGRATTKAGNLDYYKVGGSAEAGNTTVSGYTLDSSGVAPFITIEVFR